MGDCELASFRNVLLRQQSTTTGNWHRFCPFYERMAPAPAPRQDSAMAGVINYERQAKCWSTGHRVTLQRVSLGDGRGEEGMSSMAIDYLPRIPVGQQPMELVERKGLGHPDSLYDAIMEAIFVALCRTYLDAIGQGLHHVRSQSVRASGQRRTRP